MSSIRDLARRALERHVSDRCFTVSSPSGETVKHGAVRAGSEARSPLESARLEPVSGVSSWGPETLPVKHLVPRAVHPETAVEQSLPRVECEPVAAWRAGLNRLDAQVAPCPLFRDWPGVHRAALDFLDQHGDEAVRLGWTTPELFGVHRLVGTIRLDCSGGLMVSGGRPVAELDATTIRFSGGLAFRRSEIPAGLVVPVWEFGK